MQDEILIPKNFFASSTLALSSDFLTQKKVPLPLASLSLIPIILRLDRRIHETKEPVGGWIPRPSRGMTKGEGGLSTGSQPSPQLPFRLKTSFRPRIGGRVRLQPESQRRLHLPNHGPRLSPG